MLRLDFGALFGGLVGSSEENTRKAIQTAEAVAPCVLWLDELEKGLGGVSEGSTDSGTSQRVFGTILNWLQEKTAPVFIVATANNVNALPPELLRKGRFDEIFFVDLPTEIERREITMVMGKRYGVNINSAEIAVVTYGFSGSEIEEAVKSAMYLAFSDGRRPVTTEDVIREVMVTTPLSKTMEERLEGLRRWAKGRARRASRAEPMGKGNSAAKRGRRIID